MSSLREDALDLNGASAGEPKPNPEMDSVDAIGVKAGINLDGNRPLAVKETLDARDSDRPLQDKAESETNLE